MMLDCLVAGSGPNCIQLMNANHSVRTSKVALYSVEG
jgi:hypothetical protein